MVRNSEKVEKGEIHTLGPVMVRKLEHVDNETQTLYDLEYGDKH